MSERFPVEFRDLGRCGYIETLEQMRQWTDARDVSTVDQIWQLEHDPVYTQGVSCAEEPLNADPRIPVVKSDRGGQITYHGPGQLITYFLWDLRRRRLGVRQLVALLQNLTIEILAELGLEGSTREGAPGVYIEEKKIAALGLRVRSGCSYHGLSINVDMDLEPFSKINPCGYKGLEVTSLKEQGSSAAVQDIAARMQQLLL